VRSLFKHLLSFEQIDWWVLAGGIALNVIIATVSALLGAYWSVSEATADAYASYGPLVMLLGVFLLCFAAGALVSRMSPEVPLRHAFISSLGAAALYLVAGVLTFTPTLLMVAVVAVAGNLNGAMLALPRPHSRR
jgi:hypothetical protein